MRTVAEGKILAFLLQAGKSYNKKITSFNLIRLHYKMIILEVLP